jgi:hypothetical protein
MLLAVGLLFTWAGYRHMHILTFNTFLTITLALGFATLAAFALPRSPSAS